MISVGCLPNSSRACHFQTSFSLSEPQGCYRREKFVLGKGNSLLRCEDPRTPSTCRTLNSVRSGWGNPEKLASRKGTMHASRGESTLNAEATDLNEQSIAGPSVESHLDLLQRFTSEKSPDKGGKTIAEQLESQVDADKGEEVAVPLAQNVTLEASQLTIHQKRNIRRQKYLDEVAKRNDAPFFTTVALIVILPPSVILGVAVATGYVQLFP
ncbi:hypothetical protein R1flu_014482 [Riccia fluitans]|uniref:Uncharacterized protein n=1 Tax=Riccia fluitans TaxID=41844 RepID=A0ABD1YGM3_9MARC